MSFFRKKEETRTDYSEIKNAVQNESVYSPQPQTYTPPQEQIPIPDTAPLFVKIEKYKEIIGSMHEIRNFISGIKQLFLVMNELQGIQQESMNMLKTSVQRMEKSIEWIDQAILRPVGLEEPPYGDVESKQIEQSLHELQIEISSLRKDLDKIR